METIVENISVTPARQLIQLVSPQTQARIAAILADSKDSDYEKTTKDLKQAIESTFKAVL